jgi:hypothetical protein
LTDEQLYLLIHAMGVRRAAESETDMDRMIAAHATAQAPKALQAWAERKSADMPPDDASRAAANQRTIGTLSRLFPTAVKVG